MQKEWKQKIAVKQFQHFKPWIQNRPDPWKLGSTKEHTLLESLKSLGKLKEDQYILPWVELRLSLFKVHFDLRKVYFTVTWKIYQIFTFQNCLISSKPWTPEKFAQKTWCQRMSEIQTFCTILTASHYENRRPKPRFEDKISISKYDWLSWKAYKAQITQKVFEIVTISTRKLPTYTNNDYQKEIIRGVFMRTADRGILPLDSFTMQ